MAWIFLPFGILMPAVRPPWSMQPDDPATMQVRVRDARHLEPLREIMGDKLGPTVITDNFDYEARAYCVPADFAEAIGKIITEIDYERFKPTTERYPATAGQLHSAYVSVWSTLYGKMSTPQHKAGYSRGASAADVKAAAGSDIEIPSWVPVRRDRDDQATGYIGFQGAGGWPASDEDEEFLRELRDELDAREAAEEIEDLGPDLTEHFEPVPDEVRTRIFEAFDAAQGHTEESWEAYLAAQREGSRKPDREEPEEHPHDWFFPGQERTEVVRPVAETYADEHGTPFGHPEWVLPHNPEAEQRLLTAILEPAKPDEAKDEEPEYLSKRQIYTALGITWPHQRRRFRKFREQHAEWSVYNDVIASDIPQLRAEWAAFQKGGRA